MKKKKRLQLPARSRQVVWRRTKFSRMNSSVKLLTKGGETRLLLERDQKRDQAKGEALGFFPKTFVLSQAQETSISIFRSSSSVCGP